MTIIIPPNAPPHLAELEENLKNIFIQIAHQDAQSLREAAPSWSFVLDDMRREQKDNGDIVLSTLSSAAAYEKHAAVLEAYSRNPVVIRKEILPRLTRDAQEAICYGAYRDVIASFDKMIASTKKSQWISAEAALAEARVVKDLVLDVFQLHGGKMNIEGDLYIGLLSIGVATEQMIKDIQFYMLTTAPAETVRAVWADETETTRYIYAPLLRKFAAARGNTAVTQVVADLTAGVPEMPTHLAKALKSLGPKR